jgi:hypothetical protein
LKVLKPGKVAEKFEQDSARSAEEVQEQSKSREEISLHVQEGRGLAKVSKTMKSSIIGRRHVEKEWEIQELELWKVC